VIGTTRSQGQGEIFDNALVGQFRHEGKACGGLGITGPSAERLATLNDPKQRVTPIGIAVQCRFVDFHFVTQSIRTVPVPGKAE
jgi:hypothetical protein